MARAPLTNQVFRFDAKNSNVIDGIPRLLGSWFWGSELIIKLIGNLFLNPLKVYFLGFSLRPRQLSRGRITRLTSGNFTCCHTETERRDYDFCLSKSHYTDTDRTIRERDPRALPTELQRRPLKGYTV